MDQIKIKFLEGLNDNIISLPEPLWSTDFFPDYNWHFVIFSDDEKVFFCSRECLFGTGIYSSQGNVSFYDYFRNRLGLPSGVLISEKDLLKYGRTDVTFYKIDDENFYMDFSVH
jgi:hypothetical protein